jgi:PAS domain S-box-containing protein
MISSIQWDGSPLTMLDDVSALDFASIFDALDVGIVVLDRRGCVVGWNDWMARITVQSRRAALGTPLSDVFPEVRGTRLLTVIEDAFEAGSSSILTHSLNRLLPLRGDGGQELLHNIVVRPISCGGSDFCLLQINDVTASVTRERVLRERQNARYHAIVDSAPDAIITTRLDGTIEWMNGAVEQVFGYAPSELLGRRIDVLLGTNANLSPVFAGGEAAGNSARPLPVVGRRKQGEEAYFDVSFGHWRADERVFVTTIWRDVTERIAAAAALQRSNEELEARVVERTREREVALAQLFESQKIETIGQLTGGVAHDFNNLLAVILSSLTMLKKAIPVDPRTSRLLEGAIQGAERGATLTGRLLAFARRQELKLEAVEIQHLIPEMLDFLRQSTGPNISINVDIPADVHPVRIDANQLELAIMNLAVNARDAMPAGGSLTIACRNEEADDTKDRPKTLPPGAYVRLSIADTGQGMSDSTLVKAMEPFFTTKGIGKGTGLGLSMVNGLTAQAGGGMHISSELGKGTVVTLWLPCARKEDVPQTLRHQVSPPPKGLARSLRVLLVEDDLLVSMSTADMLTDLGHDVFEVPSAAEALRVLQTNARFDVVVTDYSMPGMNGLDLATNIRRTSRELPIILATGYAELPAHEAFEFPRLGKPYTQDGLARALAAAVDTAGNGDAAAAVGRISSVREAAAEAGPHVDASSPPEH